MTKIAAFLVALILGLAPQISAKGSPNVIFFAVDDLCDWVGAMGHTQAKTPNMDALAKRGVSFNNAHCPGVFCAPSRSAIFTGRFASTTGCYRTEIYFHNHPELRPLQVSFAKAGYATYGAGKLFHHATGYIDHRGWTKFFLRNEAAKREGWPLDSWGKDTPLPDPFPNSIYNRGRQITGGMFLEWAAIPNEREKDMADTKRVNWACDILKQKHDVPFFLAVGLYAPHFPNYVPKKYFDLYGGMDIKLPPVQKDDLKDLSPTGRKWALEAATAGSHATTVKHDQWQAAVKGYLACVTFVDAQVGRLLAQLEARGQVKNTWVILWSDHGWHLGEKQHWGKWTGWQRSTRVPLVVVPPAGSKDKYALGAECDNPVGLIDLYPTLLDICNLPKVSRLDGVSLRSMLEKPGMASDRLVVTTFDKGNHALSGTRWRYIRYQDGSEELYNRKDDPNEWVNLASRKEHASVRERLSKALDKIVADSK